MRKLPTLILIHGAPGNSDHSVFKPAFSTLRDVERSLTEFRRIGGVESLVISEKAGVKMGWGTDLIGKTQMMQRHEFAVRSQVQSAESILHAMYVMNPIILNRADEIGRLSPGMRRDVVVTPVNASRSPGGVGVHSITRQRRRKMT